jgi:hypothetical protein
MNKALILCTLFGVALALGCADQNSANVNGTGAQRGTIYGVSGAGSLGGGGGHPPNQNPNKNIP